MEKAGLLSAVADPATPGNLNIAGFLALALAAASVFAIPDEGVALFAEVALAAVLGSTGLALLSGGSLLGRLQNP